MTIDHGLARDGLTAEGAARLVLDWAASACRTAGGVTGRGTTRTPPAGLLRMAAALAEPAEDTVTALRALTRCTAARLGAGSPPFGDGGAIGLGALLLAAAIGGRASPAPARLLAEAVAPPRLAAGDTASGWADALARHAVVTPFVAVSPVTAEGSAAPAGAEPVVPPAGAEPLVEVLLAASPLTAVLHRPAAGRLSADTTTVEVDAAVDLLRRPRGPAVLATALSAWSPDPRVLGWRTDLLTRLARSGSDPGFVADTYVTARLRHGSHWDAELRSAARRLSSRRELPDQGSIATVRYWLPLANLRRDTDLVGARSTLRECRTALELVERHRSALQAVAA